MQKVTAALIITYTAVLSIAVGAQQTPADGPRFANGTSLVRPANYREWPFVGSSLGLTYAQRDAATPSFGNVFVNPSSYRAFMQTGRWPDGTMLVLEVRQSSSDGALVKGGRYQTSNILVLEAQVKDSRLPGGWGFFSWGPGRALKDVADLTPADASVRDEGTCVECHTKHAAVERTFVQYYPTLLEVARQKGTLNPGF